MSCVACGKPIGFSNDGVKFCSGCSDLVRKQRKCEIPGCNSMTEAFYTQCTYHYHRLQKEIRLAHSRKMHSPQPPRPYRSTNVAAAAAAPERRRVSRSPPPPRPATSTDAPPRQPTASASSSSTTQSKPKLTSSSSSSPPPPMPKPLPPPALAEPAPAQAIKAPGAAATKIDAAAANARRVLKRVPESSTAPAAAAAAQPEHRKRPRQPMPPNVIVEYECNACGAVNVVTREVRFLQTFVVRDNNSAATAAGDECPATTTTTAATDCKSPVSTTDQMRDEDAEREVNAILNCKDTGIDDCEFQVNIPNATTTTK